VIVGPAVSPCSMTAGGVLAALFLALAHIAQPYESLNALLMRFTLGALLMTAVIAISFGSRFADRSGGTKRHASMETKLIARLAFRIIGILFLLACLFGISIYVIIGIRSWEAEKTLHAHYLVLDVLYGYVQVKGTWPNTWEDMKEMNPRGHYAFWKWPNDCEAIKGRIAVKFDLQNEDIHSMTPESFDLVRPRGPSFVMPEWNVADLIELMKERIDKNEKDKRP